MQPIWSVKSSRASLLLLLLALFSLISVTVASTADRPNEPTSAAVYLISNSSLICTGFPAPTSFCKCTCFSNSTIIPLDPAKPGSSSSALDKVYNIYERAFDDPSADPEPPVPQVIERAQKYRALNCNDCNRKFCLDYDLPICKDAKEDDVFTTCFQRDSRKDEAVVFIFIFATGGLLAWAVLKPWIERYLEAARERRSYMPVAENDS
ncbi:hypothetical protein N7462_008740 [Penicillium macrosclerotiorum]|uniref:uncharacterized protein n=1 Tax=Penicillium macrosclerotiorum TaxID=303699 RepID=UPI00254676D7|nr:uncharacterized protein N7462_008740 [Penicillium macrosclerotiorum]KAJ5675843.1 hypothetical protein N7462_008740 [Penicillium macrosclerotiorum]